MYRDWSRDDPAADAEDYYTDIGDLPEYERHRIIREVIRDDYEYEEAEVWG